MKKQLLIFIFLTVTTSFVLAQTPRFSLATDASLLRSFKKGQRYWSIGQTVSFLFHFSEKDAAYAWFAYYSNGKFSNTADATAKSTTTIPQSLRYNNKAELQFKHISLGWRRYLRGGYDVEKSWSVYGYAGFGLMLGNVANVHSISVDTSMYVVPVLSGKAHFKRLTLDLGLGVECPVGADVFTYFEGRALVPTTDYTSHYLFVNKNAPFTALVNAGIRILF